MIDNQDTSPENTCPVCEATDITIFIEILQVPVHCNLLWPTRAEAIQAPRGDIRLGFCQDCGHVFNLAFKPELMEYTQAYENSLHFSPHFQSYAESLAAGLIDRYELYNKDIIEIGCGQGDFLRLLCQLGHNRGVGFDPSYVPEEDTKTNGEQITFIQDFYSEKYAKYGVDLICCRQVLEHIQFPREFLNTIRRSIGNQRKTVVFFEVPDVMFTLRDGSIWDLIYEHFSYFGVNSLACLFGSCGFEVYSLTEAYGGQFLCLEAMPGQDLGTSTGDSEGTLDGMAALVTTFADKYRSMVENWRHDLERMGQAEQRVVVWGGGSKGVTFLNVLKTQDQIAYVVDINPRKQGEYIAGTGQQLVPPEFLQTYRPDVVIVMNPIYQDEILQRVEGLDLNPELVSVLAGMN